MKRLLFISILLTLPLYSLQSSEADSVKKAQEVAQKWLQLIDQKKYSKSWEQAANMFKAQVKKNDWKQKVKVVRDKVGEFESRKVKMSKFLTTLPGAPKGEYVVLQFESSFKNHQNAIETITPMKDGDGQWRVSGYYIK